MKIKSIFLVFFSLLLCSACGRIDNVPISSDAETSDVIESALSSDNSYKTESSLVSEESSLVEESRTDGETDIFGEDGILGEENVDYIVIDALQTSKNSLLSLLESIEITKGEGHLPDAAPGDFIPLDRMNKADQSLVDTTAEICLTPWEEEFYFHYVYDSETGAERLSLVGKYILLVCKTDLNGIDSFYNALKNGTPITCEILSVTAIMWEETMYVNNTTAWTRNGIPCYTPGSHTSDLQEGFGCSSAVLDPDICYFRLYSAEQSEEQSESARGVFERMYERYGLAPIIF